MKRDHSLVDGRDNLILAANLKKIQETKMGRWGATILTIAEPWMIFDIEVASDCSEHWKIARNCPITLASPYKYKNERYI